MIYATKIRMRAGYPRSQSLTEIDSIFLEGDIPSGLYTKEDVHYYLKNRPNSIRVNIGPYYPHVKPAVSVNGEKYVKSEPNYYGYDNLLCLPRV